MRAAGRLLLALKRMACALAALVAPWVALYYGAWQRDMELAALIMAVGAYLYVETLATAETP